MSEALNIEGVFWDVDNTVYSNGRNMVAEDVVDTFHRLKVPHYVETRRSLPLVRRLERWNVPLDNYACLDNGATIMHLKENDIIWREWLEAEQLTEITRKVGGKCVRFSMATLEEKVNFEAGETDTNIFQYNRESPTFFAVYPLERKLEIAETLRTIAGVTFELMKYDNSDELGCFQVNRPGIDKGTGVNKIIDIADLRGKSHLAIGDAIEGDGQVFRAVREAGNGVCAAVGNADTALKKAADYVARSVDDTPGGFTDTMEYYQLVRY